MFNFHDDLAMELAIWREIITAFLSVVQSEEQSGVVSKLVAHFIQL
jgi:hypothetical protein